MDWRSRAHEVGKLLWEPRPASGLVNSAAGYEAHWSRILEQARGLAQESGNLARVLALLDLPTSGNVDLLKQFGYRALGRRVRTYVDPRYEQILFNAMLQGELRLAIANDVANIVELGSGYSKNLFHIWLNGGPATAKYIGLEYTAAGRECSQFLAGLEPTINFEARPFDYHAPSLEPIHGSTVVFSSYSIEQIPLISEAVFECLLAIPGLKKVVHIEPIGWQRPSKERWLMRHMRRSAMAMNYNRNFFDVLDHFERDGRIVVEKINKNFLAHRPNLPGTVVIWRPAR
jgi:hypothetical protein